MKTIVIPAVLLLTMLSGSALAQTKIATVDMRKLFDGYYKTKQAQAAIQDQRSQVLKDDASMKDDFKKASDDYQQLLTQANDQAVSAEERDRRKKDADAKFKQLQDRKAAIADYEQAADARMRNQLQEMHDKIMGMIQTAVDAKAKAGGYNLVLDTSPRSLTLGAAGSVDLPSVVAYTDGANDITADVLKQLNAGAPIDISTTNLVPAATPVSPPMKGGN